VSGAGATATPAAGASRFRVEVVESFVPDFDALAKAPNEGTTSVYFEAVLVPLAPGQGQVQGPGGLVVRQPQPVLVFVGAPPSRPPLEPPEGRAQRLPLAHAALATAGCCCMIC
jgi:hypothetical protein